MSGRRFYGVLMPGLLVAALAAALITSGSWTSSRLALCDLPPRSVPVLYEGDLHVVHHEPVGVLDDNAIPKGIVATFNRPVVRDGDADRPPVKPPLIFDPPLRGRFRWIGTRAAVFHPESLPLDTCVTVSVDPALRSVDGAMTADEVAAPLSVPLIILRNRSKR